MSGQLDPVFPGIQVLLNGCPSGPIPTRSPAKHNQMHWLRQPVEAEAEPEETVFGEPRAWLRTCGVTALHALRRARPDRIAL